MIVNVEFVCVDHSTDQRVVMFVVPFVCENKILKAKKLIFLKSRKTYIDFIDCRASDQKWSISFQHELGLYPWYCTMKVDFLFNVASRILTLNLKNIQTLKIGTNLFQVGLLFRVVCGNAFCWTCVQLWTPCIQANVKVARCCRISFGSLRTQRNSIAHSRLMRKTTDIGGSKIEKEHYKDLHKVFCFAKCVLLNSVSIF